MNVLHVRASGVGVSHMRTSRMRLRVHVRCVCMRELSVFSLRRYSVRKSGKIRLLDIRVAQSVLDSRVP